MKKEVNFYLFFRQSIKIFGLMSRKFLNNIKGHFISRITCNMLLKFCCYIFFSGITEFDKMAYFRTFGRLT
ncbi:hypothetical protein GCM10007028_04360 [Algibacter mikhailovii]|uniref:Uncharacterized protein n=1 Tax=Algibacter mikhailovii TaxID=425498 RepID=A0A918QTZ0_9FLAO|nr:hypothetical protein GCM10007028_04360 [Algibacter mikhailovii]